MVHAVKIRMSCSGSEGRRGNDRERPELFHILATSGFSEFIWCFSVKVSRINEDTCSWPGIQRGPSPAGCVSHPSSLAKAGATDPA